MIDFEPIHIEILKYMYENAEKASRINGFPVSFIAKKVAGNKREISVACDFLIDNMLFVKTSTRTSQSKYFTEYRYRLSAKGIDIYEKELKQMGINEVLQKAIDEDIDKLDTASPDQTMEIFNKYKGHIDGINNNLTYADRFPQELKNILEGFKLFGYRNQSDSARVGHLVTVNNQNNNTNTNTQYVAVSFEYARNSIEKNTYLSTEAISEIIQKINELEAINDEAISKQMKWTKVKGIFKWLSTQGVEIASTLVPLILKVISSTGE